MRQPESNESVVLVVILLFAFAVLGLIYQFTKGRPVPHVEYCTSNCVR